MGGREPGIASLSHLRGRSALRPFRAQRLHADLSRELPGFSSVEATFVYFVAHDDPLSADQSTLLGRLLDAGPMPADIARANFLVVPRPGTISPWSS